MRAPRRSASIPQPALRSPHAECSSVGNRVARAYTTPVSQAPDDLERLLRLARPAPREEFVRELARSLPRQRTERDRRQLRVLAVGWGLASALAVVALALSVTGLLPLTSGSSPAQAGRNCKTMIVERSARKPYFVRGRNGTIHVRYRVEIVPRFVKRCR